MNAFRGLIAGLAAAGLVVSGGASAKTLKVGHVLAGDHPVHKGLEFMAKQVAEKTGGKLTLRIYPNGQLGSQREALELMQNGLMDMTMTNVSTMENFSPLYGVLTLPYVFRDRDHAWKVLSGKVGKEILDSSSRNGLKGLTWFDNGTRSFYCHKPINTPNDLQGLKIRVQASPTTVEMIKRLGGSPTPIPWGELYTALQQNVVDCAESNITALTLARHGEIMKFFSYNEHTQVPDVLVASSKVFDKLSPEFQKALTEAADETMKYFWDLWGQELKKAEKQAVTELGVKINYPDKKPFIDLVKPMHEEAAKKSPEIAKLLAEIAAE